MYDSILTINLYIGIILSGGQDSNTVGVFDSNTGDTCYLPSLPGVTYGHTHHGAIVCGGEGEPQTCLAFSSGNWVPSHTLVEKRIFHSGWEFAQGLLLMGGYGSLNTTEIVSLRDGELGEPAFTLQSHTV